MAKSGIQMQRKRIQRASNLLKNHPQDADTSWELRDAKRERESCPLAEASTVWPNETYNLLIQNQKNAACLAQVKSKLIPAKLGIDMEFS